MKKRLTEAQIALSIDLARSGCVVDGARSPVDRILSAFLYNFSGPLPGPTFGPVLRSNLNQLFKSIIFSSQSLAARNLQSTFF